MVQGVTGRIVIGAVVALALFGALVGASSSAADSVATPTGNVAQAATPVPVILFDDDFSTYSRRWLETESPKAWALYADEMFYITITSPGVSLWSVPDFETVLRDYHIEVTATVQAGGEDAQFGLVLDAQDEAAFYAFVITLAGEWRLMWYEANEWRDLTPPDSVALDETWVDAMVDGAPVHLQVDVTGGSTLALWVDDQLLQTVSIDDTLAGAVFGLVARAEHGFIDVAFDNVLVTTLIREYDE
jgi:hypothetical protein